MIEYVARRLVYALLTMIGITLAVFLLIHAAPGDPVSFYSGSIGARSIPADVIQEIRRAHHLDEPIFVQYLYWLQASMSLDFGRSFIDRRPVTDRIVEKLPNTLTLNTIAFLLALLVALPLGLLTAANSSGALNRFSGPLLLLLYSLPSYWVALLLMQFFSIELQWLPLYGVVSNAYDQMGPFAKVSDRLRHLVLPVLTLTYGQMAVLARFSRATILEVIEADYVTTARAKGLRESAVLIRHAFRNALIPLITVLGLTVPYLLSGSVIVESMFAWDGLGRLYFDSVLSRDYPTVMALTTMGATATLLCYLATDLLYSAADPRVRVGSEVP